MSKFKVGDKVVINNRGHVLYGEDLFNPRNMEGTVALIKDWGLPVRVLWDNGLQNAYSECALDLSSPFTLENE